MHQELLKYVYKIFVFCIFQQITQRYKTYGQICRSGNFSKTSQTCLKHHVQPKSFEEARNHCKSDGGSLAKVSDNATDLLILGLLSRPKLIHLAWIGMKNDPADVTKWYWTRDGSLVQPTHDRISKNDMIITNTENCGIYFNMLGRSSEWRAFNCSNTQPFICEMNAESPGDTYGINCSQNCSVNCRKSENKTSSSGESGYCLEGCTDGYMGRSCREVCTNNTYGPGCLKKCSPHCGGISKNCHPSNGSCVDTCEDGFYGPKCDGSHATEEQLVELNQRQDFMTALAIVVLICISTCFCFLTFVGFKLVEDFAEDREVESQKAWDQPLDYRTLSELQRLDMLSETQREFDDKILAFIAPNGTSSASIELELQRLDMPSETHTEV